MNHGRFMLALALALLTRAAAAQSPEPPPSVALSWQEPDHPSAIYHVKDDARLAVLAINKSDQPVDFSGEILFGPRTDGDFKPLSVTPVTAARLAPGERVRIPVAITFGAAGGYELRFRHGDALAAVEAAPGGPVRLQCIFAPRVNPHAGSPWIALLPRAAATTPGLLTDYAQQTSVCRFILDERFAYDPAQNVGLGFGASTGAAAKQIDAMLAEAARGKLEITLRVTVPLDTDPATVLKSIDAFKKYLGDAAARARGTLKAVAIAPARKPGKPLSEAEQSLFRSYYAAGHDALKKADKQVLLLGAGSAAATAELLRPRDPKLSDVDALALADASFEPLIAAELAPERKLPLVVLPPGVDAPAWPSAVAALAAHAAAVPVPPPELDNGVTAHLLGNAAFVQRLRLAAPAKDGTTAKTDLPFIALFQGNDFAVAAVAGMGAGTDADALHPALLACHPVVALDPPDASLPPLPTLEVSDDTHTMRVVDGAGLPVDCRVGDSLFVPVAAPGVFLLAGGSADDLAGSLRPAVPHLLPWWSVSASVTGNGLELLLENISTAAHPGQVRVFSTDDAGAAPLAESDFDSIAAGKVEKIHVNLKPPADTPARVVVEIRCPGTPARVQRCRVEIQQTSGR